MKFKRSSKKIIQSHNLLGRRLLKMSRAAESKAISTKNPDPILLETASVLSELSEEHFRKGELFGDKFIQIK